MLWQRLSERLVLLATRDVAIGLAWAGLGLWQATSGGSPLTTTIVIVVVAMSVGVALFRRAPALALILVWLAAVIQILTATNLLGVQVGVLVVAYGIARYGRVVTVWLGGFAIPVGAAVGEYYLFEHSAALPSTIDIATPILRHTGIGVVSVFVLGSAILGAPWALGLIIRLNARYKRLATERELASARAVAAEEVASLRARQAQLARDVHDLVGHSLAVIIAQADAAQFAAGDTNDYVRNGLANIATVARGSLAEVRVVLSRTQAFPMAAPASGLDFVGLLDRVRAAGSDVRATSQGTPAEMGRPLAVVLYRVLQEMLTNAIKHGVRGGRIDVEQTWERTNVTLRVRNVIGPSVTARSSAGSAPSTGLDGIRLRLHEVGGTLIVTRTDGDEALPLFTATARVPLDAQRGAP